MSREHRPGAVFWIDHYVVPTNDLPKSLDFIKNILGGVFYHQLPLTTKARQRRVPIGVFSKVGHYHSVGSFLQDKMLPPTQGLGKGTPRHGYFVRAGDIDKHLRRLDQHHGRIPIRLKPLLTAKRGRRFTSRTRTGINMSFGRQGRCPPARWKPITRPESAVSLTLCSSREILAAPLSFTAVSSEWIRSRARMFRRTGWRFDWWAVDGSSTSRWTNWTSARVVTTSGTAITEHWH